MKKKYLLVFTIFICLLTYSQNQNITIDNSFPYHVNEQTLGRATIGGDTIFISSSRTNPLRFQLTNGDANNPLVVINKGGQVKIESPNSYSWGAITFESCKFIKISGAGHPNFKYGFELSADQCGLAFVELSSDCEAEFIKIDHEGFFGIMAKKDYDGNPPVPYPVFENLIIHDCFIENVSEGMYLGETKSPGMEFKHVKIYNNIVRNTLRESIQIANMVEDVEIYNNTLLNAGLANINYQTSILQIGNNSVANVFNNILIEAPSTGIAVYGKGDCTFTNNYLASNLGIFVDNRSINDSLAPIEIKQNYFREINGNQIIKNYNEINHITAEDNNYETDVTFFLNQYANWSNYTTTNNNLVSVTEIEFTDPATNDYSLTSNNPIEYQNMGAPSGLEYFDPVPKQIIISAKMITDLVIGGSVNTPLFLFDEQNLNIENGDHATSNSWKPDSAMNEASYHIVIDLGKHYYISDINLHDMHDDYNLTVEYSDESNWSTLFTDPCDTYNTWSKNETDVTTRFLRFSMYENVFAAVNEIIIYGYPVIKESEQIVITSEMVIDQVDGGSVNSPLFLFDEQDLNLEVGEHAISDSWKPYFTDVNAPYYVVIDLGQEYYISEINLHDMHAVHDFTVEYGDPTNWSALFVDPLDKFRFWNKHITDISTRFLRLSMQESPYAAVNEIIIYGYPIIEGLEEVIDVTVIDNQAPTAIAQDITVTLDEFGDATITADDIDNGSSDNYTFTLSIDVTTFDCTNIGLENTVTLTVTDASGNIDATTANVTILEHFKETLDLKSLSSFEAFTGTGAVTNSGTFTGNVGTNVGALTGFTGPDFNGSIHFNDALTAQAELDLLKVYIHLNNVFVTHPGTHAPAFGSGETLTPGVYDIGGAGSVAGTLTLNGQGDPNAVFIMKFKGAFTAGAASNIVLINGADAANVFWVAQGALSVGANSTIKGTLLAYPGAITLGVNSSIEGRLLSSVGAITVGVGGTATMPGTMNLPINPMVSYTPAAAVDVLGSIENFSLFTSNGAVANASTSGILGDVGANVGAISGFATSAHIGSFYNADAVTAQAKIDLNNAYSQLMLIPTTVPNHTPAFGSGEILEPGVYSTPGAGSLAGTITLDGQNNPDAIFIFKFNGAFAAAAQSKVILSNGTRRCNVFWISEGAASIGSFSTIKGTVLAHNGAATMGAGGNLEGRLLSTGGAIGFSTGVVYTVVHDVECDTSTAQKTTVKTAAKKAVDTAITSFEEELQVYPNPSKGVFNIKLSTVNIQTDIYLFDTTGKLIVTKSISKENNSGALIRIGNNNLSSGIYLVKIITNNKAVTKKVIVEKR
jgi:hypothetical protein